MRIHQKSTLKDSKRKEVIFPEENGKFIFPAANGRIQPLGGDQELRTPTLIREHPIRGESHRDFLGESKRSLPPPLQDSFPDAGEAINDFWSMSGYFIYRHHVEPRVKLYSPRKESFRIPLQQIDVSRTAHTNLDVNQEKRIDDCWKIDGSRDLSDPWTSFSQFTLLEEIPPNGKTWSGWRLTAADIQARSLMTRTLDKFGKKRLAEGEAKVVERKAPSGERTKIARDLFHRPRRQGI